MRNDTPWQTYPAHATPIVYSDQGAQYQSLAWQKHMEEAGAIPSMSRKGNCLDNSVMENFFGHLREEMFNHTHYTTVDNLTSALNDYIVWYNTYRISTRLKGLSPVQYRAQALAA